MEQLRQERRRPREKSEANAISIVPNVVLPLLMADMGIEENTCSNSLEADHDSVSVAAQSPMRASTLGAKSQIPSRRMRGSHSRGQAMMRSRRTGARWRGAGKLKLIAVQELWLQMWCRRAGRSSAMLVGMGTRRTYFRSM